MATEPGVVTKLGLHGPRTVWVKIVPSGACESCASRHECGAHSGEQEREVEVLNEVGASVGDRIQLSIATGSLMKATFLLYIFPVLCMLAGGIAGQVIATRRHWDPSLFSVIAALVCLAISILAVRFGGNRMARKAAYQPRIIRILARNPHDSDASPC